MISRLYFLELNEGFGGYGEKNGSDSCWEFSLKFADRTAFLQQHIHFLLLVGTAGVKSCTYTEGESNQEGGGIKEYFYPQSLLMLFS